MRRTAMGSHVIADFHDCGASTADVDGALQAMRAAVVAMGATLRDLHSQVFLPQGHTAVAILSESHLAVHSWPEWDYIAVDAFTCGEHVQPAAGIEVLRAFFQPQRVSIHQMARGHGVAVARPDGLEPLSTRKWNRERHKIGQENR